MTCEKNLEKLAAISAAVHEYNLRRDARKMGCSFITRAKMEDPSFAPSSTSPFKKLPKRTRRLIETLLKRRST